MKRELELHLDYCDECYQMTNHIGDECQKCKHNDVNDNDFMDDEEMYNIKIK